MTSATAASPSRLARIRRHLAGARVVARRVVDVFPLRPLGLILGGGAVGCVLYYGRKRQDVVLYVAGLGLGGLLAVSLLAVVVTAVVLRLAFRPRLPSSAPAADPGDGTLRLDAGSLAPTGFSLPALGWLPFVSIGWDWIEPDSVAVTTRLERGRLVEEVRHRERGEHRRTVRRVLVEDVFGLCRVGLRFVELGRRVVQPARGRPFTAPLIEAIAGGDNVSHPMGPPDGDLIEMRRYVAGDPMKRVLWKTYAKTRTLMVRMPERAIAPTRRTLAYLVVGDGDEAPAGVARMALETHAFGPDWRFGADGGEGAVKTVGEALPLIVRSRAARDRGGAGLASFLDEASDFGQSRCVLFVPARPGGWLAPVEEAIRRRHGRVEVIVATDGIRDPADTRRWRRLLLLPESTDDGAERARAEELDALTTRLAATGATVRVIDRPTGRWYGRPSALRPHPRPDPRRTA